NETILLVDDEEVLLEYSVLILSEYGYTIITAESAKEALELLKKTHVDLMITDVIMPEMDGYQLVAEVTKLYPKIKIQILSGFSDGSKSNLISDSLYNNRLHKPVSSNNLLLTIRNLLDEGK
ncbi:MAG: response regulator, partial [Kangiellaceae bacterium]|nr:response regulator [Kangiellaceae bacterium]